MRRCKKVAQRSEDKGARLRIEAGQICSRSTARSTGGEGRLTARSTGVHDVHRVSPVDRPVDRGKERSTVARSGRPTDIALLSVRVRSTARSIVDMGRSTGRSIDRRILAILSGFRFLFFLGSIQSRFPNTLELCGYK